MVLKPPVCFLSLSFSQSVIQSVRTSVRQSVRPSDRQTDRQSVSQPTSQSVSHSTSQSFSLLRSSSGLSHATLPRPPGFEQDYQSFNQLARRDRKSFIQCFRMFVRCLINEGSLRHNLDNVDTKSKTNEPDFPSLVRLSTFINSPLTSRHISLKYFHVNDIY